MDEPRQQTEWVDSPTESPQQRSLPPEADPEVQCCASPWPWAASRAVCLGSRGADTSQTSPPKTAACGSALHDASASVWRQWEAQASITGASRTCASSSDAAAMTSLQAKVSLAVQESRRTVKILIHTELYFLNIIILLLLRIEN